MARLVEFLSNWIGNIDKSNLCPFAKRAWDVDRCKVIMVEDLHNTTLRFFLIFSTHKIISRTLG